MNLKEIVRELARRGNHQDLVEAADNHEDDTAEKAPETEEAEDAKES